MRKNNEHADRAKQFMPFDALRGFREALREKERVIVPHMELTQDAIDEINRRLCAIRRNDIVSVVYFYRDESLRITGMVSKVDPAGQALTVVKTRIPFCDIQELVIDAGGREAED